VQEQWSPGGDHCERSRKRLNKFSRKRLHERKNLGNEKNLIRQNAARRQLGYLRSEHKPIDAWREGTLEGKDQEPENGQGSHVEGLTVVGTGILKPEKRQSESSQRAVQQRVGKKDKKGMDSRYQ